MKTGRNEPCPCGSGKKFKRCCGAAFPSEERALGGHFAPQRNVPLIETNDILRKTISRDAPRIGSSFDRFCETELASIDELFSAAAFIVLAGFKRAVHDESQAHQTMASLLYNAGSGLTAATQLIRLGHTLSVCVIARNVLEIIATVLHLGTRPSDLERFLKGDFESSKAISTAKKVLPPFGGMYGLLSNEFVHLGRLYTEPQLYRPYESRKDEGLDTALVVLKTNVWLFYVTAELTFQNVVKKPRYWRRASAISAGQALFAYDPSAAEREWMEKFLGMNQGNQMSTDATSRGV
ncbi:MAG: YecA family protein [Terriglobales bacterium]